MNIIHLMAKDPEVPSSFHLGVKIHETFIYVLFIRGASISGGSLWALQFFFVISVTQVIVYSLLQKRNQILWALLSKECWWNMS
jgi:hypothetical protein